MGELERNLRQRFLIEECQTLRQDCQIFEFQVKTIIYIYRSQHLLFSTGSIRQQLLPSILNFEERPEKGGFVSDNGMGRIWLDMDFKEEPNHEEERNKPDTERKQKHNLNKNFNP